MFLILVVVSYTAEAPQNLVVIIAPVLTARFMYNYEIDLTSFPALGNLESSDYLEAYGTQ